MNYMYDDSKRLVCCSCGRDVMEYHKNNCAYKDEYL
jgi:hypothetical protein